MYDHDALIRLSLIIVIGFTPVKSRLDLVGGLIEPLTVPHVSLVVGMREVITSINCGMPPYEKVSLAPYIVAVYLFLSAMSGKIGLVVLSVLAKICGNITAEKNDIAGLGTPWDGPGGRSVHETIEEQIDVCGELFFVVKQKIGQCLRHVEIQDIDHIHTSCPDVVAHQPKYCCIRLSKRS